MQLVIRDVNQGPFLTQVLRFGRDNERLTDQQLAAIKGKAVLMSLKFADKYYNKYKMHLLEQAAHDVIGVVSLGLQELSQRDTAKALALLQAPEGPIKPFQKGWSMLISVSSKQPGGNNLFGDVDARLLDKISSPPDVEEWQGWQEYEKALAEHNKARLMTLLDQHCFACENDHPTMEDKLAEALLYRILCGNGSGAAKLKVKQDLKRKLAREIELNEAWYDTDYLAAQLELLLAELPSELIAGLRQDLSKGFVPNLLHTLGFVRQYQLLQKENASPEKLDNFEMRAGLKHPLLGWPLYHDF
ncbi:TPA: cold adaptation protein AtcC [Aeromonas veronii]